MKRFLIIPALLFPMLLSAATAVRLDDFLASAQVKEVRLLQRESLYEKIMEVMIEQPLDHRNPEAGSFMQRLYISHIDTTRPVVFVTEGYDASYYYTTEIAAELKCNQIVAEHRYFGNSTPDSLDWRYLDTWQAASDHHRIVSLFKEFYPGKWLTTGISKGGQTVMYHDYYYPGDVDVHVPYVAPLNFSVEDKRIYEFLDQVGPKMERKRVRRFQKRALRKQKKYLPAFREFSEEKGYSYSLAGGIEKAYEYCVLEYDFAYWQWGYAVPSRIPGPGTPPDEVIAHMNRVAGFDYFSDASISELQPFFVQALSEMGYYGYELQAFEKQLRHVDNPIFSFTLPDGMECSFEAELSEKVGKYVEEAPNYVFIYGEYDTWSATAVSHTAHPNSRIFIKEAGSHRTRINNMPEEQKAEVYRTIRALLGESDS